MFFKHWKKGPVHKLRQVLDVLFFSGGAMAVVLMLLQIYLLAYSGGRSLPGSTEWLVQLNFSGFTHLPLTRIDPQQPASSQMYADAIPTSAHLLVVREKIDLILIGFQFAWLLLAYGTFILIVYLLRKIFIRMDSNEFFDPLTPGRLRMLGWTIIISSLLHTTVNYLYGYYTSSLLKSVPFVMKYRMLDSIGNPVSVESSPLLNLHPYTLFIGAVMFALAVAFQHGRDLKQEQSLTV